MVVQFPFLFKKALVGAGSDNRFVSHFDGSDRFAGLIERTLDPDIVLGAVSFCAENQYVPA